MTQDIAEKLRDSLQNISGVGPTQIDPAFWGAIGEEVLGAHELVDHRVVEIDPLIRRDFTADGRLLDTGALVVRGVFTSSVGIQSELELTINQENRPLSELVISYLGAIANEKLRLAQEQHSLLPENRWQATRGDYIHNVIAA